MDKTVYHATLKQMQEAGADRNYCHGWAMGALDNPSLEEQRVTDAYSAGFEHGASGNLDGYRDWVGVA